MAWFGYIYCGSQRPTGVPVHGPTLCGKGEIDEARQHCVDFAKEHGPVWRFDILAPETIDGATCAGEVIERRELVSGNWLMMDA